MKKNILIRKASVRDAFFVAELFNLYRVFYRKDSDPKLALKFIRERLKKKDSIILMAMETKEKAVGFVQLYPSFSSTSVAKIFVLNDLFVTPSTRKQGVGKALIAAALEIAKKQKAVRVDLATEKSNTSAQQLYDGIGFKENVDYKFYSKAV